MSPHRFSNLVEIEDGKLIVQCPECKQWFDPDTLQAVTQSGSDPENPIEVLVCKSHLEKNEENPYLLHGEELERTVLRRKQGRN